MLKKIFRLPVEEFRKNKSQTLSSEFFSVKFFPNKLQYNRFAVIISAKTIPKSSLRHLIKRKIIAQSVNLPNTQTDFLFIALPKAKALNPKEIKIQIEKFFSKIKL